MSTDDLLVMSSNWLKLEPVLAHAEVRLRRRVEAHAWLIQYRMRKWSGHIKCDMHWKIDQIKKTAYPGWYDKTTRTLWYNEVYLLAVEAETLVLRLRAIKYHGSTVYIDPSHTKLPSIRDYDLRPDIT